MITGAGGISTLLGTNNVVEVTKSMESGNAKSKLILNAMSYQISKEIGKCAPVLFGKVDAIILTGGIANSEFIVNSIKERVSFIGPVIVFPGEDELLALAQGACRVLSGKESAKEYI
jgi:butyrate kinase